MMIRTIADSTCRQMVRSKTFIGLMVIYCIAVLLSRIIGWMSGTDGNKITTDVVFSLQSIIGVLVAVAIGTALVQTEIQQRTLYTILSRPVGRWQFILGKYIGLAWGLCTGQLLMLCIGLTYLWLTGAEVTWWLFVAGLLTILEVLIMAAMSMMFTVVSSPLLAVVLSLIVYTLGHMVATLPQLMNHLEMWQQWIAGVFAAMVPNFGEFTYRNIAAYGMPLSAADFFQALVYALLWICLLLTITIIVFRRKQL